MPDQKPTASLSLDLDNKWSYMKTHGDPGWEEYPTYLDVVVPRALDFLKARGLKITFFVVGKDASLPENHAAIQSLADAGHEIGNHSFNHEPWLHLYSEDAIDAELAQTEEHLERVTGQKPIGFRGPGYSLSPTVLRVLLRRGYRYDCSTLPTFLGPLARLYYFMTTKLTDEEKAQRAKLFGTVEEGLRPNKPYWWRIDGGQMLEIPVTTMPIFKVPIHASYVLYLALYSPALAMLYFRIAIAMCRLTGVEPSLLLHPLDFMSGDDAPELQFFPAMRMPLARKLDLLSRIIDMLMRQYEVLPMHAHADRVRARKQLRVLEPHFAHSPAEQS